MSEQRVAHGSSCKETCRGTYQIEAFRVSRAVERGIVSDLRKSPRCKRAHRPGQLPRACRHEK